MKKERNLLTADENDFIHVEEVADKHKISIGQQQALLDAGKLNAFERLPGQDEYVWPSMEPDKYEKITGIKVPDPYSPKKGEGLEFVVDCKPKYRRLHDREIAKLKPEELTRLYYLRSEIDNIVKSKFEATHSSAKRAKQKLQNHVRQAVKYGTIKSYSDLFHDPIIQDIQKEQNWTESTIRTYAQKCGIPGEKRGRKPMK